MKNRRFRPVAWVFVAVVPLAGLQQAVARDCNLNGVPDHCDANCDLPGCLQYPCGRSDDTNPQNGIPDECEGAPAIGTFTSTADFTTLGTLINLDESVPGQLSRSQLPRPMPNLWVAASNRGTIVRIDTDSDTILGEYFTAPDGRGKNPSRTAVNLDGEVWVSNRSEGSQFGFGSITRIGVLNGGTLVPPIACEADNRATFAPPFAYNTCVDRNGDGMITTSNGLIPLPWAYEDTTPPQFGTVDTAEDECIISYVQVNGKNPGHLAVNKDNDVWVGGNYRNNTFNLLDGDTGAILETFDVGVGGHGGIIDCDDVLWSVSTAGLPGVFRYNTNFGIDDPACCVPDILVDSNNDGVINEDDNAVEGTSALFFSVNSDDDNLNDVSDFDDLGPVYFEDDLQEMQLFVPCSISDPAAWWSLSWVDPNPDPLIDTIRVWLQPDKSDGDETNPGPGDQVENGVQYLEWPPPASVWLEALDTYDEMDLTFTISIPGARLQRSNVILVLSKCRPAPPPGNRYWVGIKKSGSFTGVEADISSRSQTPLCGEFAGLPYKNNAGSLVWVGIGGPGWLWCQAGYLRSFVKNSSVLVDSVYYECNWGPDELNDREIGVTHAPPPAGGVRFGVVKLGAAGPWEFQWNGARFGLFADENGYWNNVQFPWTVEIEGELVNLQDKLVGTNTSRCAINDIKVWWNYTGPRDDKMQISDGDLRYKPPVPGANEWGKNRLNSRGFEIWDKNPIQ